VNTLEAVQWAIGCDWQKARIGAPPLPRRPAFAGYQYCIEALAARKLW
jgi:hypothetical protein